MNVTRRLWISVVFVAVLVGGSVGAYVAGVRPVLGLDLEGGVSVILSAPEGTPRSVMERALENIRRRIDAFGTAEPLLYLSGTNIEAQIPGLARGTIQERPKDQHCLVGEAGRNFGCFESEPDASTELEGTSVQPLVSQACLVGLGDSPRCFGTEREATKTLDDIKVENQNGQWCVTDTGLDQDPCRDTKAEAQAIVDGISLDVSQDWCLQTADDRSLTSDEGTGCFASEADAQAALDTVAVESFSSQFCVVSSADVNLGCYLTREQAQAKLQETGQERLLQIIGTTARLEQREVLDAIPESDPRFQQTPVTCPDGPTQTGECSFGALRDQDVVFLDRAGTTKYRLGAVEITGDMIRRATAVYDTGGGTAVGTGWQISFDLTDEGTDVFADVTTRLVGRQLAIVVDNEVVSSPTVQDAITNGNGVITGSFTEARAKDLATQLNAGALPVNLKKQQVLTVSPTLGAESLRQGLIAGLAGLTALALYLLFYYRLLGVVAMLGMMTWAVLAVALVAVAGRAVGYSLTLAGVAGLVISLGVTTDSYIVFFERLKDEVRHGRTPRAAVQPAFKRAYKTIIAADIVTALAALVLYVTAISSVRGFALTLGVATALDLFVVYFFKRPVVFLIARSPRLVNLRGFGLTSGVAAEPARGEPVPVAGGSR